MSSLHKGLNDYLKEGFCSFHTPGHKGNPEFFQGFNFPGWDLTELPGLDMLHVPIGIIADAQKKAAQVFGAEETYFLINGATAGNQAMLMGLEKTNGKVLIERQAHRSVMSALILTGLAPEYLSPVVHPEFNLPLGLDTQESLNYLKGSLAWHLTYPSYYGTTIDLNFFSVQRDRDFPGTLLLIDQAHGSHYLHDLFPPSALELGADMVLQSTHKTLSALTQGAMLHIHGSRINRSKLRQSLELLQSSSPSYLLLASLDSAGEYAQKRERWARLHEEVLKLRQNVKGLRILSDEDEGQFGIHQVDWSKILINTSSLGIPAPVCVEQLRKNYHIEPELWDNENILFVLGIGNTPEDVQRLTSGLQSLTKNLSINSDKKLYYKLNHRFEYPPLPPQQLTPREAFLASKRQVDLKESLGKIAGETISPYPPGVPLIVMGEEITPEVLEVLEYSNIRWQGWEGFAQKTLWVVDEV